MVSYALMISGNYLARLTLANRDIGGSQRTPNALRWRFSELLEILTIGKNDQLTQYVMRSAEGMARPSPTRWSQLNMPVISITILKLRSSRSGSAIVQQTPRLPMKCWSERAMRGIGG